MVECVLILLPRGQNHSPQLLRLSIDRTSDITEASDMIQMRVKYLDNVEGGHIFDKIV